MCGVGPVPPAAGEGLRRRSKSAQVSQIPVNLIHKHGMLYTRLLLWSGGVQWLSLRRKKKTRGLLVRSSASYGGTKAVRATNLKLYYC